MALTLTYIGTTTPQTIGSVTADAVFNSVPIGTAAADRWVLCCLWNNGDNNTPSGANIDGITSTIMYDPAVTPHAPYWFITKVPNNTTATVTINYPGTQAGTGAISVYTINGFPNLTRQGGAYFTGTGTSFNSVGISVPVVAGGVVIDSFFNPKTAGAPAMTWNANSPAMTNDMVNTAFGALGFYMNMRSRAVAAAGTQDGGSFTNNLGLTLRTSLLSIAEQANADVASVLTSFAGVSQVATVKESMPTAITTLLKKPTIAAAVTINESSAITTLLRAPTQAAAVTVSVPTTIATLLQAPTQALVMDVNSGNQSTIDQTLFGITQDFEAITNHADIAQTLFGITQDFQAITNHADIAQTLFGITQQITALMVPNADIAQTLPAFVQSLVASTAPDVDTTIDQTLFGITQAFVGRHSPHVDTTIDTVLTALSQAATVVESMPTAIAQTLPRFTQEIDGTEVITATANTVLGLTTGSLDSTFIEYRNTGVDSGFGGSIRTFPSINFGPANTNLTIVVALNYGTAGIRLPQSMTIGGVTATRAARAALATARCVDIWYASVPAGGVGDVRVVFGDGNNGTIGVWAIRGAVDAFVGSDVNSGNTYSGFLSCRPGSVGILALNGAGNATFTDPPTTDYLNVAQAVSTTFKASGGDIALSGSTWFPSASDTSGLTNYASVVFMPAVGGAFSLTQVLNMNVATGAFIDQTLSGFTQQLNVSSITARIDQTLRKLTQSFVGTVALPPNVIAHLIDQTLPTFSQEIDVIVSPNADIDQTLPGFTQEIDVFTVPNVETFIDQTFEGLTQRLTVVEEMIATIDTVLPFSIQQVAVVEEFTGGIDQTLPGFTQEIDVIVEMIAFIDQILSGFTQEIDVIVTDPAGVIGLHADQTLPGFTQEIDVFVYKTDISVELQGIRQRIDVLAPKPKHHERGPHAVPMPSKDMPIHPGELELFRRKVYARAVDAMVPPPIIARNNLTTQRHPHSRPVVNRTPLGKKPS